MSKRTLATIAIIITTVIWGTTFVAIKIVLGEMPPFTVALFRFLLASAVLLPALHLNPAWRANRRALDWPRLALLGFTGVTVYFVTENLGMVYTSAASGSLIVAGIPALTVVLSAFFLRERIPLSRACGIAASVAGVAAIVLAAAPPDARSSNPLLGNLLLCVSAVAWAIYTVLSKDVTRRLPGMIVSTYSIVFGTIFLVPFAGFELVMVGLSPVSPSTWAIITYLGIVASALCYFLWNFGLRYLEASVTSTFLNLLPVVGLVLAVLVLGEKVLPLQVAGGTLVLAGIYIASRPVPLAQAGATSATE